MSSERSARRGPFFHGTKADLTHGDFLTAGFRSNCRPEIVMKHIYFTALRDGAGLAAELAPGDAPPRAYLVEPTGEFENDPNVIALRDKYVAHSVTAFEQAVAFAHPTNSSFARRAQDVVAKELHEMGRDAVYTLPHLGVPKIPERSVTKRRKV